MRLKTRRRFVLPMLTAVIVALCATTPWARQHGGSPLSPIGKSEFTLNEKKISVVYSRPSIRGRKIMGELVPYDQVWRSGANDATTFVTEADLEIGGMPLFKGSYTLFTLPSQKGWKLIINRQTGQWGTDYDANQDMGRIDMKVDQLSSPVEQFTISFVPEGDGAVMKLEWEHTSASVPVKGRMPGAPPPSPPGTAEVALNGKKISVQYSRPSVRGRKIMGGLVPWEKVWRTGANMATGFTTEADLEIGGLVVPKGSYTLFTIPSAKSWQLIVNKQTGQRGGDYDEKQDLGRAEMKVEQLSGPVEQFTISLAPAKGGAVMNLDWENTRASVWLKEKR